MLCVVTSTAEYKAKVLSSMENAHIMLEMAEKCSNYAKIEDYAFPFGLCFVRQIMLKIMLAYCINA